MVILLIFLLGDDLLPTEKRRERHRQIDRGEREREGKAGMYISKIWGQTFSVTILLFLRA